MPSIITHAVVAVATGKIASVKKLPGKFWVISILCSVLPDADVIAFKFGISYGHFFGHRGFFHSLTFALVISLIIYFLFFRKEKLFSRPVYVILYFFLLTASHGILDTFTSGGLGIALFSPFDPTRYFAPITPIVVSPIGVAAFFSWWGVEVLLSEMFLVWIPLGFAFFLVNILRKRNILKKT